MTVLTKHWEIHSILFSVTTADVITGCTPVGGGVSTHGRVDDVVKWGSSILQHHLSADSRFQRRASLVVVVEVKGRGGSAASCTRHRHVISFSDCQVPGVVVRRHNRLTGGVWEEHVFIVNTCLSLSHTHTHTHTHVLSKSCSRFSRILPNLSKSTYVGQSP